MKGPFLIFREFVERASWFTAIVSAAGSIGPVQYLVGEILPGAEIPALLSPRRFPVFWMP